MQALSAYSRVAFPIIVMLAVIGVALMIWGDSGDYIITSRTQENGDGVRVVPRTNSTNEGIGGPLQSIDDLSRHQNSTPRIQFPISFSGLQTAVYAPKNAVLTGKVTYRQTGVSGALIRLSDPESPILATSDPDGRFSLEIPAQVRRSEAWVTLLAATSSTLSGSSRAALPLGQGATTVDIGAIELSENLRIEVEVRDELDATAPDTLISVTQYHPSEFRVGSFRTNAKGRAILTLGTGRYFFNARNGPLISHTACLVDESSSLSPLTLRLSPVAIARLAVVDENNGTSLNNADIFVTASLPRGSDSARYNLDISDSSRAKFDLDKYEIELPNNSPFTYSARAEQSGYMSTGFQTVILIPDEDVKCHLSPIAALTWTVEHVECSNQLADQRLLFSFPKGYPLGSHPRTFTEKANEITVMTPLSPAQMMAALAVATDGCVGCLDFGLFSSGSPNRLRLYSPRTLLVDIVDQGGRPLGGWEIEARPLKPSKSLKFSATVNEAGRAVLDQIPPCTLQISGRPLLSQNKRFRELGVIEITDSLITERRYSVANSFEACFKISTGGHRIVPGNLYLSSRNASLEGTTIQGAESSVTTTIWPHDSSRAVAVSFRGNGISEAVVYIPPDRFDGLYTAAIELSPSSSINVRVVLEHEIDCYEFALYRWDETSRFWKSTDLPIATEGHKQGLSFRGVGEGEYRVVERVSGIHSDTIRIGNESQEHLVNLELTGIGEISGQVLGAAGSQLQILATWSTLDGTESVRRRVAVGTQFKVLAPVGRQVSVKVLSVSNLGTNDPQPQRTLTELQVTAPTSGIEIRLSK